MAITKTTPLLLLGLFLSLATFANLQASDSLIRREWKVDGVARHALLYTPPKAQTNAPAPVMFAFHGHGGSMRATANGFRLHELWPEAIVVYPQGLNTPGRLTDPEGKRPGWQREPGDQGDRDLKFFDAILASLKKDYTINTNRIYATGHSNGGAFTYLLWQTRGEHFTAFAPSAAMHSITKSRGPAPVSSSSTETNGPASIIPGPPLRLSRAIDDPEWSKALLRDTPILHLAGKKDDLVKFQWQERFLEMLRTQKKCSKGEPWQEDNRCTLYKSKVGGNIITYIHPGTHSFPREGPEIIVKFFKEQVRQ